MDKKILIEFRDKLTFETIHKANLYEKEILLAYRKILKEFSDNYQDYKKYFSEFLRSLETNNVNSLAYSIKLFFEYFNELIDLDEFSPFDMSILSTNYNRDTVKRLTDVFENSLSKNQIFRISEGTFDLSTLSESDYDSIISLLVDGIQENANDLNINVSNIQDSAINLVILRQLLKSVSQIELFYYIVGLYIDKLSINEFFQAGRDTVEEILISSFKDNVPELGYFNSYRLYSNIGSIHASLIYAILSMECITRKERPYSEKYIKEIIWQSIKFFRNIGLFDIAVQLYDLIPSNLEYESYEKRSIDHTYYTTLIYMKDPSVPDKILDYLHKERENIISGGKDDATPWLLLIGK